MGHFRGAEKSEGHLVRHSPDVVRRNRVPFILALTADFIQVLDRCRNDSQQLRDGLDDIPAMSSDLFILVQHGIFDQNVQRGADQLVLILQLNRGPIGQADDSF